MTVRSILHFPRREVKPGVPPPTPPDPALMFPHPANAELFAWMKESAKVADPDKNPTYTSEGYEVRAHPDLSSILYDLVRDPSVKKGWAYGRPVMAGSNGLVFAFAGGTHDLFFRLKKNQFDQARKDGGRFDPTYGENWMQFMIGQRVGILLPWQDASKRWADVAWQNALGE